MGKEKKEMVNEYKDLMRVHEEHDQYHRLIYQKDEEMLHYHDELLKLLSEMENVPDSISEGMKRHEEFYVEFRAMLNKHKAILNEHDAYRSTFKKRRVKKDALRSKLDAMTAEHEAINADHEFLKDMMAEVRSEHNQYRKWYNNMMAQK